jgi:hypothetical protein
MPHQIHTARGVGPEPAAPKYVSTYFPLDHLPPLVLVFIDRGEEMGKGLLLLVYRGLFIDEMKFIY